MKSKYQTRYNKQQRLFMMIKSKLTNKMIASITRFTKSNAKLNCHVSCKAPVGGNQQSNFKMQFPLCDGFRSGMRRAVQLSQTLG